MLKKAITYENIEGDNVTEDHYFHLSKADIIEMQFQFDGGLEAWLSRIGSSNDPKEIIAGFKTLVEKSYGTRTADGKFLKDRQQTQAFMSSEAYSEFFMDIVTDANKAAEFMNGIIPKGLDVYAAKIEAAASGTPTETPALAKAETALGSAAEMTEAERVSVLTRENTPDGGQGVRVLTAQEVADMEPDELKSGIATGRYKLS